MAMCCTIGAIGRLSNGGNGLPSPPFFVAKKSWQRYADVMGSIHQCIHFYLLKTTIIALRGERGRKVGQAKDLADRDVNIERDYLKYELFVFYRDNFWRIVTVLVTRMYMVLC